MEKYLTTDFCKNLRAVRVLDPNYVKNLNGDKYAMFCNITLVNPFNMKLRDEYNKYIEYLPEVYEEYGEERIDTIDFWESHKEEFPDLHLVALRALLLPLNSVDAERSFSQYKYLLKERRTNLHEEKIKKFIFLKFNKDF